jgi:hypothetical protein
VTAAWRSYGKIIRPEDTLLTLQQPAYFMPMPCMIAQSYHIDPGSKHPLGYIGGDAAAAGRVLAVYYYEIRIAGRSQRRQSRQQGIGPNLAYDVAHH